MILYSIPLVNEDRYTYQSNLLSSASVYSTKRAGLNAPPRIMPRAVPTRQRLAYTAVPSPVGNSSLEPVGRRKSSLADPQSCVAAKRESGNVSHERRQDPEAGNSGKNGSPDEPAGAEGQVHEPSKKSDLVASRMNSDDQGPDIQDEDGEMNGTAEKKFVVPNIRSILQQSYDVHEEVKPSRCISKSMQITPKASRRPSAEPRAKTKKRVVCRTAVADRSMNSSFLMLADRSIHCATEAPDQTLALRDQVNKERREQGRLATVLEVWMKKREKTEQEYVRLVGAEDELAVAKEKETSFILNQEETLAKLVREKRGLAVQQQGMVRLRQQCSVEREDGKTEAGGAVGGEGQRKVQGDTAGAVEVRADRRHRSRRWENQGPRGRVRTVRTGQRYYSVVFTLLFLYIRNTPPQCGF